MLSLSFHFCHALRKKKYPSFPSLIRDFTSPTCVTMFLYAAHALKTIFFSCSTSIREQRDGFEMATPQTDIFGALRWLQSVTERLLFLLRGRKGVLLQINTKPWPGWFQILQKWPLGSTLMDLAEQKRIATWPSSSEIWSKRRDIFLWLNL